MTAPVRVEWFDPGGTPGLAAIEHHPGSNAMGFITVQPDGSLLVSVDDDYYDGVISHDAARELAWAILATPP